MGCAPCVEATEGVERKCEPRTPTTTRGASKRRRKWRGSATRRSFAPKASDGGSGEEVRARPLGRVLPHASGVEATKEVERKCEDRRRVGRRRSDGGSGEEVRESPPGRS